MNFRRKQRLLSVWEKLTKFAKWCDKHGIPKLFIEIVLKLFLWWLTHR